ncbi:hypothetical protein PMIT1306_01293 [Prochlorococcus sp. MIT 1306]|nr:hypothetical protein PMIT1306_01293 [Prochlorococcus sp. MIT 1306]
MSIGVVVGLHLNVVGICIANIEPFGCCSDRVTRANQVGVGRIRTNDPLTTKNQTIIDLIDVDTSGIELDLSAINMNVSTEIPKALDLTIEQSTAIFFCIGAREDGFILIGFYFKDQWASSKAAVFLDA